MKEYKLSDILTIKNGRDYKNLKNGLYPVYGSGGLMCTVDNYLYDRPSVLLPRKGTLSNIQFADSPFWTVDTLYYTEIDTHLADPYYLYYYLKQLDLTRLDSGTGVPSMTFDSYYNIKVCLPNIDKQRAVGRLLSVVDDKIQLNKRINDNLEAMAKQLYDYWFVQFDFPNEEGKPYKSSGGAMVWNEKLKRKIPNGWTVETVGTYANCKSGYAIKSSDFKAKGIPVIKIGNIQEDYSLNMNGCQYIDNNANKLFHVYQNDVVIAMTGATIGKFAIVPYSKTGYFVNQRVGKFELGNNPIKKMPYLINSLKIEYFRNQIFQLANGCAQPNISAEQINNISLLYPSTNILSVYNMKCKWMYEQIANCRYQIGVLTKLRDKLLPLLMNGQASVNSD